MQLGFFSFLEFKPYQILVYKVVPICIRPVLGNEKLFLEVFFIQVFHLKLSNNYRIYNLNNLMKYDVRINLVGAQNDLHIPFMK